MESKYNNFISQFEILDKKVCRKGFHYHHIVPKSKQTELDDRGVLLLPSQHLWAHILYDQEHGTKTATRLKNISHINPTCYEDCVPLDKMERELCEEMSEKFSGEGGPFYGKHHSEEQRKKWSKERKGVSLPEETKVQMSKSHKGLLWWNNKIIETQSKECPGEDWVRGRLKKV